MDLDLKCVCRNAVEEGNICGMGKDFLAMLGDETLSDLTLIVENRRIPVHRWVSWRNPSPPCEGYRETRVIVLITITTHDDDDDPR